MNAPSRKPDPGPEPGRGPTTAGPVVAISDAHAAAALLALLRDHPFELPVELGAVMGILNDRGRL